MSSALGIIALITALGATVCAFIFIVPEKKRSATNKFLQIVHDLLNVKMLILETVLQAIYIFCTAFVFIEGFFMLFQTSWYGEWLGGQGLLVMILGPVAVRLAYELILMLVLLVKNVIQINNKLKNQNEGEASDGFTLPKFEKAPKAPKAPKYAPQQQYVPQQQYIPQAAPQAAPQYVTAFCTECGSRVNPDGTCPNCGK